LEVRPYLNFAHLGSVKSSVDKGSCEKSVEGTQKLVKRFIWNQGFNPLAAGDEENNGHRITQSSSEFLHHASYCDKHYDRYSSTEISEKTSEQPT
jgi:hypothetical protein